MPRNVVPFLIRQGCRQIVLEKPNRTQIRNYTRTHSSRSAEQEEARQLDDLSDVLPEQQRTDLSDPEQLVPLLQALDQKQLLDVKTKLNALSAELTRIRTRIPSLVPTTLTAPANEVPPYQLGRPRTLLRELDPKFQAFQNQIDHTRAHIQDLQSEDYEKKGDGLGKWIEEVEGMSKREKEERLQEMLYEEEGLKVRLEESGRKNLELVEGMRGKVGERTKVKVKGKVEFKREEEAVEEVKEKGGGKAEVKKEDALSMEDLQKRLNAQMGVK